jgi:hypothetical protein
MSDTITVSVDTRGLQAAIPVLVEYGRRTTEEQCVTSMGMILQDAQNLTPFVATIRMDAELEVEAFGVTKTGRLSKAKKPRRKDYRVQGQEGLMIVIARMHPNSNYNRITGGRWALQKPPTKGEQEFWEWVADALSRMTRARHSSGHFLQAGYIAARDACVSSPLFKNRYRARSSGDAVNKLNTLDRKRLGSIEMSGLASDTFLIRAENNVGDREGAGNDVLDAKHRQALIDYSLPALEDAVKKETEACEAELERRLLEGWPKLNRLLA